MIGRCVYSSDYSGTCFCGLVRNEEGLCIFGEVVYKSQQVFVPAWGHQIWACYVLDVTLKGGVGSSTSSGATNSLSSFRL